MSAVALTSCELTFGSPYKNDPLGNFDFFFYELKQNYAYKNRSFPVDSPAGLSLAAIRSQLRPALAAEPSWSNLARALQQVIDVYIADPHLYSTHSPVGSLADDDQSVLARLRPPEQIDLEFANLKNRKLANGYQFSYLSSGRSPPLLYGMISSQNTQEKIGYLYIRDLVEQLGGTARLGNKGKVFARLSDSILTKLQQQGASKLIVDIRSDAGGGVYNGRRIASRLVGKRSKFMLSEARTNSSSYQSIPEYVEPDGVDYFRGKPLAVLVNSNTCSAGEMFALMLKQAPDFRGVWGVPTRGCTGTIIDRELPVGWLFRMTTSRTYEASGRDYFQVGLLPVNANDKPTKTYLKGDKALNAAIAALAALPP